METIPSSARDAAGNGGDNVTRECHICGRDLTDDPVERKVELYQECYGTFCEDEVYELCAEHYAAVARLFGSGE